MLLARASQAQDADVIRGRITGDKAEAVARASISAISVSGGVTRTTATDAEGRYTITFANGDGDYWVTVNAVGYAVRKFEIKRLADQQILVGDVRLVRTSTTLDPVQITAVRRQRAEKDTASSDIGGTETRPVTEVLSAEQLADLALLAGTIPGVQIVANDGAPSGFSVLGLSQEQNQTTLNGMRFGGAAMPRDAAFDVSLALSPYDVARGGFSGAQLSLRSRPPTNLSLRANSFALDAPALQWIDAAGRALGQEYNNLSLGGVITTPIQRDRAFVHVAYQGSQRFTDLHTILEANHDALAALGVAPDSLERLRGILDSFGVPLTVNAVPSLRLSRQALVYGALDVTAPRASSGRALNVMYTGSWNHQAPAALGTTAFPAQGGERNGWQGGVQMRHTGSFGFGILSETQISASASHNEGSRYLDLPNATVRIVSQLADNESSVQHIVFGGSPALDRAQGTTLFAASNQLSWFSFNNKHRLKLNSELSRESINEQLAANTLGTFQFNSLADLQSGRPSMFMRQLASSSHDIANYRAGVALGDAFSLLPGLQMSYGVRVDVNRFDAGPARNPAIETAFGLRNDAIPNRMDVSPRLGFAWSYGTARQVHAISGAARVPRAVVRGGIGVFQGVPTPSSITSVIDATGLPSAARQLTCAGPAAPSPNWAAYRQSTDAIPTICTNGAGAQPFVSANPAVVMYDRAYVPPRSVRSNVQWVGQVLDGRFQLQADFTASINVSQPGIIDRNFANAVQFTLPTEAGRPVFVPVASVDPLTGAAADNARVSSQFASVTELRSDLRSNARQVTISVAPAGVHTTLRWNLAYLHSKIRETTRGFSSTGGNPLGIEHARSSFDSRHQLVYSIGYNVLDLLRVSWSGSFRSGLPFTPSVSGDVNGDGRSNDRAFVFDPAVVPSSTESVAIAQLLTSGPRPARDCLRRQLGRVAQRNSCEGPWTSSTSLNISLNPVRWWRNNRFDMALQISNPLGGADLLLHGADRLHGWGQPAAIDPTLYYVKGFNSATRTFRYDVNSRFGDTSPSRTSVRTPVAITAIVRFDFGPTREKQTLNMQLDRGRRAVGARMSEAALRSAMASGGVFNPLSAILRNADTLQLTGLQADSLTFLNGQYARRIDAIWAPIVKQLAALPDRYDRDEAYATFVVGRRLTIDMLARLAPDVLTLLTPSQRRALPIEVQSHLNTRYLATIRSGTAGLGLAFLPGISAPTGSSTGGATVSAGGRP